MQPLCFVLMPFGRKRDAQGRETDFDGVYRKLIAPAILAAGLDAMRADQEQLGGTIHKPMFERLMLCDYAIADITSANPNVYYELGIRHALRPHSTILIFAAGTSLPFDVAPLRGLSYATDASGQVVAASEEVAALAAMLGKAREERSVDSPLFEMFTDLPQHTIDHSKTDTFRDRVAYSKRLKDDLATARGDGAAAVRALAERPDLRRIQDLDVGVVIDLFLSMRAVRAYADMVALHGRMSPPLQRARLIREQLAFALNRLGQDKAAERLLQDLIREYGASSETNGLLGRVYKDRWDRTTAQGQSFEAAGHLHQAIEAYLTGFEADFRDAYPGVNAVTLMELSDPPDGRQARLLPIVRYAAERRIVHGGDYWDHATLLELAVLEGDAAAAELQLGRALALVRESWELETTAHNLQMIHEARLRRGAGREWTAEIIRLLQDKQRAL